MFLCIENDGVAPLQGFITLGLSTARGKADKIGQFGSGVKMSILTCLRQNINPTIFLGESQLEFGTKDDKMGDKAYKHLTYRFQGQEKDLPIALEFGALDWNGLDMGLREFVSNAIDAGGHKVEIVTNTQPSADKTRIFLPLTPDVMKFFSNLREKFLHFSPEFTNKTGIMSKDGETTAKFYRKGVFVRESRDNSLFNYNFGDDVKIDESRNMDDYAVRSHAGRLWAKADVESLKQLFSKLGKIKDGIFESNLYISGYMIDKKNWCQAWSEVYGDAVVADPLSQGQLIVKATNKGYKVVMCHTGWVGILISAGIKTVNSKLDNVDEMGREVTKAPTNVNTLVKQVWDKLVSAKMTNGKPFPKVNTFVKLNDGGEIKFGFYNWVDESINLDKTNGVNIHTILHELGHHITGAADDTSDFTDFFCKLSVILMDL